MGRTPSYRLDQQPVWVQTLVNDLRSEKEELYAQLETLEGIVATLESDFEREAIRTIDGGEEAVYLEAHETTPKPCPTPYCACSRQWM